LSGKPTLRFRAPLHLAVAALLPALAGAAIIDRIAVSVGNSVVTASDIDREIRLTAFLNGQPPDFSAANKRATADRMVEQRLVHREIETSRYPEPQPSEIQPALAAFRARYYPAEADYRRALEAFHISDQDVKDELLWQRTLLQFIDVRFRPAVQVTADEIQHYFDTVLEPRLRAEHPGRAISLEDYRSQIEDTLAEQREDQEMETWLREARKRTPIIFHDEAFQ